MTLSMPCHFASDQWTSDSVAPECIGILTGTLSFNTLNYGKPMLPASHPFKVSWSDRVSNVYVSTWEGHGVTSARQNWQWFTTCILYLVFLLTPGVNLRGQPTTTCSHFSCNNLPIKLTPWTIEKIDPLFKVEVLPVKWKYLKKFLVS